MKPRKRQFQPGKRTFTRGERLVTIRRTANGYRQTVRLSRDNVLPEQSYAIPENQELKESCDLASGQIATSQISFAGLEPAKDTERRFFTEGLTIEFHFNRDNRRLLERLLSRPYSGKEIFPAGKECSSVHQMAISSDELNLLRLRGFPIREVYRHKVGVMEGNHLAY